jgi:hypothetical protein
MNTKKLIETSMIVLLVVTLSVGMAAAQGVLQSTDSTGAGEIDNFIVDDVVYARGLSLVDYDGNNKADVYIVVDSAKPEKWDDGKPIDTAGHRKVLVRTNVDTNNINIGAGSGPLFLGTVVDKTLSNVNGVNEIPAPGDFDIIYDCNQDGYYNVSNDYVDYGICSGFRTDIPEFATIAIPLIALLGLVLYMRRKKD